MSDSEIPRARRQSGGTPNVFAYTCRLIMDNRYTTRWYRLPACDKGKFPHQASRNESRHGAIQAEAPFGYARLRAAGPLPRSESWPAPWGRGPFVALAVIDQPGFASVM